MPVRHALLAAAMLFPMTIAAQSGGPYAPIVLLLPAGARTLAMGNVGVAGRDDDALFFNPAQLVVARGMSASAERYSSTAGGGALSAITPFNGGGVGIGVRTATYDVPDNFFPADRGSMLNDAPVPATSLEATVALAQVVKGIRVGGAAKYVEDEASTVRLSRAAFDVGVSKDFFRFYNVGLVVQNIGQAMKIPCTLDHAPPACPILPLAPGASDNGLLQVNLPLRTTLGVATARPVGPLDVAATGAVSLLRKDFLIPAGGGEIGYSWLDGYDVAIRAGVRRPLPGEEAFTAGAGFRMDRLTIDYALETLAGGRVGHRVGLRIR